MTRLSAGSAIPLLFGACLALGAHTSDVLTHIGVEPQVELPTRLTLRIDAEPDELLPGLPLSLRVWITNDGTSPAEVPVRVALQVSPPRGEPFVAHTTMRGEVRTLDLPARPPVVLAPGETRDVSFWSGEPWFAGDERFRTTGTFRLQLVADPALDSAKLAGVKRILDQPGLASPIVSNETTFTVLEPVGADLAVWKAIRAGSGTCTPEVTELIWRDYPASRYAAYCVNDSNDPDVLKRIAGFEASLAKSPHPHWADGYRLNIAQFWISRASALTATDVEAAVDAYERARTVLEPLAKTAQSPRDRKQAAELLESRVRTRAEVDERHRALHGFDDRPIRFYASCFENLPGGSRKIWFGYNNPNSKAIDVAVGNDNKFTPPPFNRAQPVTFRPGIFDFAFHIVTKEPTLVWHLQGKTAQFKLPDTIQCPKGFDPNDPSTWQVEEE